jgi:hypothetical protein
MGSMCVVNICGCKLNRNLKHLVFRGVKNIVCTLRVSYGSWPTMELLISRILTEEVPVLMCLLLGSSEIPFGPMFLLYEQKTFHGQMYTSSSDCIVRPVVHGFAMLWKELVWFEASVTKVTKLYLAQPYNLPSGTTLNFISCQSSSPALQRILWFILISFQ